MPTTLVAMARRNTLVFYPTYQGLVSKLLDRPWGPEDGMTADELSAQVQTSVAAGQLVIDSTTPQQLAPLALQEFYLALGVSEMMETNHFFFVPDELEVRDNYLILVEDDNETIVWGFPVNQASLVCPKVDRRTVRAVEPDNAGEWESTNATISELLADILNCNYSEENLH